ncbi:MAG TPA: GspH/FimT family pseudopilin [Gammaproteobacteria bacterium]
MSDRPPERSALANGFTLVELVVIVLVLGILAMVASARFADQKSFEARGYYDELVSATRFAQRHAVSSGCTVRIDILASTYALTTQDSICGFGTAIQSPSGSVFSGTAPAGVTVTGGTGSYLFDARGNVGTAVDTTVTVAGGGSSLSFVITGISGFVNTP